MEGLWIRASTSMVDGVEHFLFESVRHTKSPSTVQLDELLGNRAISLDHAIKRLPGASAMDKGYLFKVWKCDLARIFPSPREYSLL